MKKFISLTLAVIMAAAAFSGCGGTENSGSSSEKPIEKESESQTLFTLPETVPLKVTGAIEKDGENYSLSSGEYKLVFEKKENEYSLLIEDKNEKAKFLSENPCEISVTTNRKLTNKEKMKSGYTSLYGRTGGGIIGEAKLTSSKGSEWSLADEFYPLNGMFSFRRTVKCIKASESAGWTTALSFVAAERTLKYSDCEYLIPANIYSSSTAYLTDTADDLGFNVSDAKAPTPLALLRRKADGDIISIARKNPYINTSSDDNGGYSKSRAHKYGSVGIFREGNVGVRVDYPCQEEGINTLAHKYAEVSTENDVRFDATIYIGNADSFMDGISDAYTKQLAVQTNMPLGTSLDLNKVYKYNIEDLNEMIYNQDGVALLPFARYVETGSGFNYYAESGYIGMQIALGYELYRYGLKYKDSKSLKNGRDILNMWADTSAYPGTNSGVFRPYRNIGGYDNTAPTLRILTDGAEGMLDAVRLAEANDKSLNIANWNKMVKGYADFLVRSQNADGSWYRAYDYDGKMVVEGNRFNIVVNADTIADSKLNTQIPVRFLVRMYERTGDRKYLTAAEKAGEFVINEIIPKGQFSGGTLDTQGVVDRESGIFCEYAMNALYSATANEKWLNAAICSAVYAFSWTFTNDFVVYNQSNLKAGIATSKGWTAGMSVISTAGYGADSFMGYMYYDLFKLYVWTGNEVFLKMADLAQNASKRIMDINGEFGYKYRSFMIEATNVSLFRFITAEGTGVWLPWITNSNVEPMTNMMQTFGTFDINEVVKKNSLDGIKDILSEYGAGGKEYGTIKG